MGGKEVVRGEEVLLRQVIEEEELIARVETNLRQEGEIVDAFSVTRRLISLFRGPHWEALDYSLKALGLSDTGQMQGSGSFGNVVIKARAFHREQGQRYKRGEVEQALRDLTTAWRILTNGALDSNRDQEAYFQAKKAVAEEARQSTL